MNDMHVLNLITDLLADKMEWGGNYLKAAQLLSDEYGLDRLGSGASGVVVDHPTDRNKVIRINGDVCTDSWTSFILFTRENYAPCFPKVYAQRHVHDGCMITIMEKLVPWNDSSVSSNTLRSAICEKNHQQLMIYFANERSIKMLGLMYDQLGYTNDLHGGNYMKRPSTGELVVIDPYHAVGQNRSYRTGPDSRFKMGPRVQVEVVTYEQRELNNALMAELSQEVAIEREKEDRMLRPIAKHVDHAQPERLYRALLPRVRDGWVRSGRAVDAPCSPRKERVHFQQLKRREPHGEFAGVGAIGVNRFAEDMRAIMAMDNVGLHRADFAALEKLALQPGMFLPNKLRGRRADVIIADSIGVPKPVRHQPDKIFITGPDARPEGRKASVPGHRPKKWESGVPCQKAAAERQRERAEVYRKLHRRAA